MEKQRFRIPIQRVEEERESAPSLREHVQVESDESGDVEKQLEETEEQLGILRDEKLRLMADRENYRKRIERIYQARQRETESRFLLGLLSVADNLERALRYARPEDGLSEGVKLTRRHLLDILRREGAEPIEAVGFPFDPALHEAVGLAPGYPRDGIVVKEESMGYLYKGQVLRPSRVVVSS